MCQNMPKTIKEERLRWVLPMETPIRIKERIIEIRKKEKQCAKKISWDLEDEGVVIHYQTVQKIIKKEGLTKKYRTRKITYNYVRIPLKKGEIVEIDVKFVPEPIDERRCYQFTAIDCASRWRHLQAYENIDNVSSIAFLKELMTVADFKIMSVKTDNGSIFTNRYLGYDRSTDPTHPRLHAFDILCNELGIDLKQKLRTWNKKYNNTKHCGLNGKTPNEMLKLLN
ncbi:MAG: Transposase [Parcubacteria group bacterium GW2011_GWA2_38_27]|nr:MAG: Transposase [Parcubacteria group bacterium GW2011_GWA2_38_27]